MKQVTEDPAHRNYQTSYGYDSLDNLTSVTQGSTARSFTYSSLKRLLSATNPESGTVSYTYDANGNLLTRTDARAVVTTFCQPGNPTLCYDGLDQLLGKTYTNDPQNAPGVTYTYDHGWLTQVSSSAASYTYTHDTIGRVNGGTQVTGGQSYMFTMSFKPFMGIDWIQYPNSSRKLTTGYDTAGRAVSLSGQIGTGTITNYASSIGYTAPGAITLMTLGTSNALSDQTCYNARLQVTDRRLGTGAATAKEIRLN